MTILFSKVEIFFLFLLWSYTWQSLQVLFTWLFATRLIFCQPLRGLSACKQLMLRWHFQFLHENHFSVPGSSETVLNRGRSMINKGSMVSLFFFHIPCLWPHLHWLLCHGVCAREQKFIACWRVVQRLFLCFGWNCLHSHPSFFSLPYTPPSSFPIF